jgi:hypothetical protein
MKRFALLFLLFFVFFSCANVETNSKKRNKVDISTEKIKSDDYELYKTNKQNGVLILFPCFPCDSKNTLSEFNIIDQANKKGISVVLMNFNQQLYLNETKLESLYQIISTLFEKNKLKKQNVFIGGFSSGGNVSLLLSNYLIKKEKSVQPNGVFIVDSPIDLLSIYKISKKNIKNNKSNDAMEESKGIITMLNSEIGNPSKTIEKYELLSPYTNQTQNTNNVLHLKNVKIRFYTEPDIDWWKKNRENDLEDLNAFQIRNFYEELKNTGFSNIELIETKEKGIRANGTKHPHSWSIVDKSNLINWMLKK